MYKSIYLARRNPSLGPDEFRERWKQHSALTGTTQRIRPYFTQVVQCARHDGVGPADATVDYDGANLLGLVERAGGYAVFDEPEARDIMLPDELVTFAGPIRDCTVVTREKVCKSGGFARFLVLRFLKFAGNDGREAHFARWCDLQSLRDGTGSCAHLVQRSVANLVVEPTPPAMDFDLVTETWFADATALDRHSCDAAVMHHLEQAISESCIAGRTVTLVARVNHSRPAIED